MTPDAAAYTDVVVSPDGRSAYALRSSYEFPAEPVRIDLATGDVTRLPSPAERPQTEGSLERVETAAADGTRVPAYLALPAGASAESPAPLLLWIHGGPLGSWNAWTWRWNPWLLTARGYAVLLPDPALSTGYGQEYIQRGWGGWGKTPFTDLMAITDAVVQRPDIDESRTAAMGGSFGGYMANWVAGQTDRFKAIVTPRQPVGAGPVRPNHRRVAILAQGNDGGNGAGELPAPARREDPDAHAGDPRRQGLPRAHWRRPAALV